MAFLDKEGLIRTVEHIKTYIANEIGKLTKADFGLSNVDNTSDADKPISTLQQNALNNKVDKIIGKGLSTNDFTTDEKNKLSFISSGAEVNQNAYSNVIVDSTTLSAKTETDSLQLVAGSNVTLTPDSSTNKITISSTGGGGGTVSSLTDLGVNATAEELNYVDGVTSNIQTQLNGKASTSTATTSANGIMSSTDKTKLDNTNIAYGTCSTAAATANKVVAISGNTNWSLKVGSIIIVKFTVTNTASNVKLNVNNTGAKSIWYNNAVYTASSNAVCGYANRYTTYMYDGTNWVWISNGVDNNTTTFNNYMQASTTSNTYTSLADFWTYCDSLMKNSASKIISGRAKLTTFTPIDGWFRYFASSQNNIGNGQWATTGSVILDNGAQLFYGVVGGGITDTSDLTVNWFSLGGNGFGSTLYQTSEPTTGLVNRMVWIA